MAEQPLPDELPPSPETRDWSELPVDALSVVFSKLGAVEILMGAGLVCRSWLNAAKVPDLWRCVDMAHHRFVSPTIRDVLPAVAPELDWSWMRFDDEPRKYIEDRGVLCAMEKVAVHRSDERLEVFEGKGFVNDELLQYIGERSPSLKGLYLDSCHYVSKKVFPEFISKCPLLEDFVVDNCEFFCGDMYEVIAKLCPQLKRLELRRYSDYPTTFVVDKPFGITMMDQLRHLTLGGIDIGNEELMAVLTLSFLM